MNDFEEPSIPPHWRRPLAAAWISFAVHAAVLVLVQVAPPAAVNLGDPVIEARLVAAATSAAESAPEQIEEAPKNAPPSEPAPEPDPEPLQLAPVDPIPEAAPVHPPAAEPAPVPPPKPPEPAPATAPSTAQAADADEPAATEVAVEAASPAPTVAVTSAVDLTYYNVRELDVQPRALREIVPTYPIEADRQRLSGKVRLQLKLEADGRISDVEIVSATPPGVFDASTVQAFREARFAPAQKGGRPVRARVVIEVLYDWEGRMRRQ